jgi:transcriptional regulator with XRE-family HTH domain
MLAVATLGEKLKDARRRAVLTQEQLAEKSGVGVATIIRLERGQVEEPRVSTLRKLAGPLEVDARELIGD